MMRSKTFFPFLSSVALFSSLSSQAFALPEDSKVVAGKASFRKVDDKTLHIEASDKSILHHSRFTIEKGEKVRFIQPSSKSTVLNKIKGQDPSQILGALESNGKVFLVNPNGVYFGPDSRVNVGSLIVSTLDLAEEDFLEGKYQFSLGAGKAGSIINEGIIASEGSIALLSPTIQNRGVLEAKVGSIALLSGKAITLDFTGDGLLSFAVEN